MLGFRGKSCNDRTCNSNWLVREDQSPRAGKINPVQFWENKANKDWFRGWEQKETSGWFMSESEMKQGHEVIHAVISHLPSTQ